jgi:hypothetical protein
MNTELLEKAELRASQCRQELRDALGDGFELANLVILPLIERAALLRRDIAALHAAIDADNAAIDADNQE